MISTKLFRKETCHVICRFTSRKQTATTVSEKQYGFSIESHEQVQHSDISFRPFAWNEQSRELMNIFPHIVKDLTEAKTRQVPPDLLRRFTTVLQYNVPTGKKLRALFLVMSYKMLENPAKLTPENIRLASILGWCIEMLHSHILILDDIVDKSETRRGEKCWYRHSNIGLCAINDAIMLENYIYVLIRKNFKNHHLYEYLLEFFHDMTIKATMGQTLDTMCVDSNGKPNFDVFTMDRFKSVAIHKTGYYNFYMPVSLAMYLAGKTDPGLHKEAKKVLFDIGVHFQVQDDFLDVYGDPLATGKIGSDIQEGKLTWFATLALDVASPVQRKIMEEHYGRSEPDSVAIIKRLYEKLDLYNLYCAYEEQNFNAIQMRIQQLPKDLPRDLFYSILDIIYKRDK